jgi:hypothetical protein
MMPSHPSQAHTALMRQLRVALLTALALVLVGLAFAAGFAFALANL